MSLHSRFIRPLSGVLLAATLLVLAACGTTNMVRLIYAPADGTVLPIPSAPRVTVVMFEDQRPHGQIGVRRDGSSFTASSTVSDWVSRSLADELTRLGLQVSFANTVDQARASSPDYIVTGVVREVWLKELRPTEYTTSMRMTISMAGRNGQLFTETLSGGQNKQVLPVSGETDKLLAETLRDVLQPAARKIQESSR